MRKAFYYEFASILLKRNPRNFLKEVIVGLIVTMLLIMVYRIGVLWGNMLVLFYSFVVHISCMVENDTFLSYRDLQVFHFKKNDLSFKAAYILQRVLLDMVVTNSLITAGTFTYLLIANGWETAVFFLTLVLIGQLLMPSYNYWAYKAGEQGVIATVTVYIIVLVLVIAATVQNIYPFSWLFSGNSYLHSVLMILAAFLYMLILDAVSLRYKNKAAAVLNTRMFFKWLKPVDVFLYKDYVLFYKNVLLQLVMIFTLYSLLITGIEDRLIPFIIAFIFGSSNMFAAKKEKEYNVIADDPLFAESTLKIGFRAIRLTKLRTILSGALIKALIGFGLLYLHRGFELKIFFPLAVILVLGSAVEFIVVYKNKWTSSLMNKTLIYFAVVLYGVITFFDNYFHLLWIYLGTLIIYCSFMITGIVIKEDSNEEKRMPQYHSRKKNEVKNIEVC